MCMNCCCKLRKIDAYNRELNRNKIKCCQLTYHTLSKVDDRYHKVSR